MQNHNREMDKAYTHLVIWQSTKVNRFLFSCKVKF